MSRKKHVSLQNCYQYQRWSRGHKARGQGQGHKKNSRPRADPLEAKAKDQGHRRKCSPKKKKKKVFKKFFSGDLYLRKPKKRSLQIFRKVSGVFQQNFNGSKIVLSSSRGQGNFRGLKASRRRPRTSKCVLEDSTSDQYFVSDNDMKQYVKTFFSKTNCFDFWSISFLFFLC